MTSHLFLKTCLASVCLFSFFSSLACRIPPEEFYCPVRADTVFCFTSLTPRTWWTRAERVPFQDCKGGRWCFVRRNNSKQSERNWMDEEERRKKMF